VQFLKAPESSGEHFVAQAFSPLLTIKPMGRRGFIRKRGCEPLDAVMAE
jgi:cob(I)alamin adenosyltransferase